MGLIVTAPLKMDFNSWANALAQDLKGVAIQSPDKFKNWYDWANSLAEFKRLGEVPVAKKELYSKKEDWRKWACQFINNLPIN